MTEKGDSALNVFGQPSVSQGAFEFLLRRAASPAADEADALYTLLLTGGIDPLFAYGQFGAESSFGTKGYATETRNWGNILYSSRYELAYGAKPYAPGNGYTYCLFPTWETGVRAYVDLLRYYRATGSVHIIEVCRRWLGKDPTRYIENIESLADAALRRIDLATVVTYIPAPNGAYVTIPTGTTFGLDPATLKVALTKTLSMPVSASAKAKVTITVDGKGDGATYGHVSSGTFGDLYVAVSSYDLKPDPETAVIAGLTATISSLHDEIADYLDRLDKIAALASEDTTNA